MDKLHKHFVLNTTTKANPKAIVKGEKYRFTVLTECLVRMEYSEDGVFEDRATQTVVNRDFPLVDYTVSDDGETLVIDTSCLTLVYKKECPFGSSTLHINPKGDKENTTGLQWFYTDEKDYVNEFNLKGTARTLDHYDGDTKVMHVEQSGLGYPLFDEEVGKLDLGYGIASRRNVPTVIYDSDKLVITDDGFVEVRPKGIIDIYYFGYGSDFISALKDFYRLTGAPPLLPKYALGNWWSRYYAYTQQEYIDLMERFKDEDIPFSVSVIDMDWHLVKLPEGYGAGWTGYTWNKELFPDYKGFLKWLHEHGLHTSLNLHPSAGVRFFEEMYPQMAKAMGIDPDSKQTVEFDAGNVKFWNNYFDILHHPYEKDGVDFWWMDWQQGSASSVKGLDPLWMLNHFHTLDIQRDGKRPIFFSRYSGPGSHRYPVGFSGDSVISWKSLDFQPYFTATASNIGYSWWSHDIGGHYHGVRDDELITRWVQFGVFSPINRLHSSISRYTSKEPWNYRKDCGDAMRDFLRLRHRLIPYTYTMSYRNYKELLPLMMPMYYTHPKSSQAYNVKNQYWFGSEMIVAPITSKADDVTTMGKVTVWLPKGIWTDFFTGRVYSGDRLIDMYRPLDTIPVLCKAGAIVPLAPHTPHDNTVSTLASLEVTVCAGADGSFALYDDDGETKDYLNGGCTLTNMTLKWGDNAVFTIDAPDGDVSVLPEQRQWTIRLAGFAKDIDISAKIDGIKADCDVSYDDKTHMTTVVLPACDVKAKIELITDAKEFDNSDCLKVCDDIILHASFKNSVKDAIYKQLCKDIPAAQKIAALNSMNLDSNLCAALSEILSAK